MDRADSLPTDLAECHRLLLAAYKQAVQLERRATESERRATESQQRIAELDRVLDATSASYEELQHEHTSTLEELAWYKRWVHGRRRERIVEAQSQQHLFDLNPSGAVEAPLLSIPRRHAKRLRAILAVVPTNANWICPVYRTIGTSRICRTRRRSAVVAGAQKTASAKT